MEINRLFQQAVSRGKLTVSRGRPRRVVATVLRATGMTFYGSEFLFELNFTRKNYATRLLWWYCAVPPLLLFHFRLKQMNTVVMDDDEVWVYARRLLSTTTKEKVRDQRQKNDWLRQVLLATVQYYRTVVSCRYSSRV